MLSLRRLSACLPPGLPRPSGCPPACLVQEMQQVRAAASRLEVGPAAAAGDEGAAAGTGRRARGPARSTATRRQTTRQAAVEVTQEDEGEEEVLQPAAAAAAEDAAAGAAAAAAAAGEDAHEDMQQEEEAGAEEVPVTDAFRELLQPQSVQPAAAALQPTVSRRARSTRSARGAVAGRATAGEEVEQQAQEVQQEEQQVEEAAAPAAARKRGRASSARAGKKQTTVVSGAEHTLSLGNSPGSPVTGAQHKGQGLCLPALPGWRLRYANVASVFLFTQCCPSCSSDPCFSACAG